MKTPEQSVEAQFRVAGKRGRQRHASGAEALGRDREQEGGDRFSSTGEIGETFLHIFAAGKSKER
ncbi:hypothetical protein BH20VER1_BH20VER1_08570 [soil metagenome]